MTVKLVNGKPLMRGGKVVTNPNCCCAPPPPPTGACCYPDGTCYEQTQEDCEACCPSGVYQGDATPCDPNPCPPCPRDITDISSVTVETTISAYDTRTATGGNCAMDYPERTVSKTWTRIDRFDSEGNVIAEPGANEFQIWWDCSGIFNIKIGDNPDGIFFVDLNAVPALVLCDVYSGEWGAIDGVCCSDPPTLRAPCGDAQSPVLCGRPDKCKNHIDGSLYSPPCNTGDRLWKDCTGEDRYANGSAWLTPANPPYDNNWYVSGFANHTLNCSMNPCEFGGENVCGTAWGIGTDPFTPGSPTLAGLIGSYTIEESQDPPTPPGHTGSAHWHMKTVVTIA